MDLRTLEIRTSEAIRKDGAEAMSRRAAKLSRGKSGHSPPWSFDQKPRP